MSDKKARNKKVEHFFFDILHDKKGYPMTECSHGYHVYCLEVESEEMYNSEFYINQDERIEDMFPWMGEEEKNLLKLKAYKHQLFKEERDGVTDEEKSKFNKKRVAELEPVVEKTEYAELVPQVWWLP